MKTKKPQLCESTIIHSDSVEKVSKKMPSLNDLDNLSNLYKNFADGTRVKILWALSISELCVCDLSHLLNMTVSAISHQLKFLRLSNLVKFRKEGKVVYYSLADEHVKSILDQGFDHIDE